MSYTTVSSNYEVVIPEEVRTRIQLKPGQRLRVTAKGGVIHLVPEPGLEKLRGVAEGASTDDIREKADRL